MYISLCIYIYVYACVCVCFLFFFFYLTQLTPPTSGSVKWKLHREEDARLDRASSASRMLHNVAGLLEWEACLAAGFDT